MKHGATACLCLIRAQAMTAHNKSESKKMAAMKAAKRIFCNARHSHSRVYAQ
jgi:hypothetical protein